MSQVPGCVYMQATGLTRWKSSLFSSHIRLSFCAAYPFMFQLSSFLSHLKFSFISHVGERKRCSRCSGRVVVEGRAYFAGWGYGCGWRRSGRQYRDWSWGLNLVGCGVRDALCEYSWLSAILCDVLRWRKFVYVRLLERSSGYRYRCVGAAMDTFAEIVPWHTERRLRARHSDRTSFPRGELL